MDESLNGTGASGPRALAEWSIGGPVSGFSQQDTVVSTVDQYRRTLRDIMDFMAFHKRIPDSIWLGGSRVSPESFLVATAGLISEGSTPADSQQKLDFKPATLKSRDHINTNPSWDWIIFPEDFNAPEMVERARLQTWSLKPALTMASGSGR